MMDKKDIVMPKLLEDNLKQLNLDMHLKSWTINEKTDQVQLIIRFVHPANQNLKTTKSDTFVRKTKYHKTRDQMRMKNFNYLKSNDINADAVEIKSASETVPMNVVLSNSVAPRKTPGQVAQFDGSASSSSKTIQYEIEPISVKDYTPVVCSDAGVQAVKPSASAQASAVEQTVGKPPSTPDVFSSPCSGDHKSLQEPRNKPRSKSLKSREPYELRTRPSNDLKPRKHWRIYNSSDSDLN